MATVELPHKLLDPLQQLANEQGSSVDEVVEKAVAEYLREQRHKQLLAEMERFKEQHKQLKEKYLGEFIGMYNGRVLDNDADGGILYSRLREKHGDLPILIVEVTGAPEQEFKRLQRKIVV